MWKKADDGWNRNRQDAREALDIAARGKVKCFFVSKPLSALSEYVLWHL